MPNVQEMSTSQLLDEFRTLIYSLGTAHDSSRNPRADALEAEILRRMAW